MYAVVNQTESKRIVLMCASSVRTGGDLPVVWLFHVWPLKMVENELRVLYLVSGESYQSLNRFRLEVNVL